MLNCKQITEQSDEYLSGDLGIYQSIQFRIHLLMCSYCRRYVRQANMLIVMLQRLYGAITPAQARQIVNAARAKDNDPEEQGPDESRD